MPAIRRNTSNFAMGTRQDKTFVKARNLVTKNKDKILARAREHMSTTNLKWCKRHHRWTLKSSTAPKKLPEATAEGGAAQSSSQARELTSTGSIAEAQTSDQNNIWYTTTPARWSDLTTTEREESSTSAIKTSKGSSTKESSTKRKSSTKTKTDSPSAADMTVTIRDFGMTAASKVHNEEKE